MKLHSFLLIAFALMFIVFATLQWNDPDPAVWVTIYGVAAALCWLTFKKKLQNWIPGLACLCFAVGAALLWPPVYEGITLNMEYSPAIEEARESLGLLICAVAMAYCFFVLKTNKSINATS